MRNKAENLSETATQAPLPRRDWILLPALSLLTILFIVGFSEISARVLWPAQLFDACRIPPAGTNARFAPNCKSRVKTAEGPWVDNSYNECGYRTRESCGPKPAGAIRVAVIGSSYSYGYFTPYDEAYTTQAGKLLTRQCRRPVEFQNLGVGGISLLDIYHRTDAALALKPDILLLALNPFDVTPEISPEEMAHRNDPAAGASPHEKIQADNWVKKHVITPVKENRSVTMLEHFMYETPATYANLFLYYGDNADYLRTPLSPRWKQRFANLDALIHDIHQKSQAASVPMAILIGEMPSQVALLNTSSRPGVDPYEFSTMLAKIAAGHQILAVDPLPGFAHRPHAMDLVYPVDGHVSPQGQRILAESLDKSFLQSGYAAFAGCSATE